MNQRRVVVNGRLIVQAWEKSTDQVSLRGMEVSARRVDTQRPAGARDLLPRGQRQRIIEEPSDGRRIGWSWIDLPKDECRLVARQRPNGFEPQGKGAGPLKSTERIRLGFPVHIADRGRELGGEVLGALMIRQCNV